MARTGLEGFTDEGGEIAKRILTQGMSKVKGMDDVRKGIYVDVEAKREIGKTMDVVMLDAATKRKLFHEKDSGQRGLRCWSDDGIYPSASVPHKVSEICRGCPEERNDRIAELLFLDVKETQAAKGRPVVFKMEVKKTAIKPIAAYVKAIKDRDGNARDHACTLTAIKMSNDKGEWYVSEPQNLREVPADLKQVVEDEFHRYVSSTEEASDADDDFNQLPVDAPF